MGTVPGDLADNRPGDAIRRKLRELQPNPVLRLFGRWLPHSTTRSWWDGLTGERVTGRRLDALRRRGWHTLHAVQWPSGADVDHLAIGPAGVFAVNSKRHRGKTVWYGDRAITVNRTPTRHVVISRSEARRVSRVLSRACGYPVPVRPVIAVVHSAKLTVKGTDPPVLVLDAARIDRVLSGLPATLMPRQVAHVYAVARSPRTWTG
ncbi:nuclease-related domain-containing protein [Streptomyces sp. LE64]|uniref:nuclease-related domain-containing protein n=1 Tax=Streptomyces sp. LE64 TaxID=3448653 RepID=UPI0040417A90